MRYLKGPDFPTGGLVVNKDDLLKIYETGTGKLRVRGKVETVKLKGGRAAACDYGDSVYHDRCKYRKISE